MLSAHLLGGFDKQAVSPHAAVAESAHRPAPLAQSAADDKENTPHTSAPVIAVSPQKAAQAASPPESPELSLRVGDASPATADQAALEDSVLTTPNKPKLAPERVSVHVVLLLLEKVEVKIGRRRFTVDGAIDVQVPEGHHRIRWRAADEATWQDAGRKSFVHPNAYMVRLRSSGETEFMQLAKSSQGPK